MSFTELPQKDESTERPQFVCKPQPSGESTLAQLQLLWLPVTFHIDLKILLLLYKGFNGLESSHIANSHVDHLLPRALQPAIPAAAERKSGVWFLSAFNLNSATSFEVHFVYDIFSYSFICLGCHPLNDKLQFNILCIDKLPLLNMSVYKDANSSKAQAKSA